MQEKQTKKEEWRRDKQLVTRTTVVDDGDDDEDADDGDSEPEEEEEGEVGALLAAVAGDGVVSGAADAELGAEGDAVALLAVFEDAVAAAGAEAGCGVEGVAVGAETRGVDAEGRHVALLEGGDDDAVAAARDARDGAERAVLVEAVLAAARGAVAADAAVLALLVRRVVDVAVAAVRRAARVGDARPRAGPAVRDGQRVVDAVGVGHAAAAVARAPVAVRGRAARPALRVRARVVRAEKVVGAARVHRRVRAVGVLQRATVGALAVRVVVVGIRARPICCVPTCACQEMRCVRSV